MDNKEKILDIALRLFSSKGYEGTGIQEIVDKAGITKPTLYYYFGNKEGVVSAIIDKYFIPFLNDLRVFTKYEGDVTLSLTNLIRLYFDFAAKNRVFYKFNLSTTYEIKESVAYKIVKPYHDEMYSSINKMFFEASNQHGNMKNREKEYTLSFMGIINVYTLLIINDEIEISEDLIYRVVRQFMYGIFS
ncbi:MAG TPA: TetR/AcrR family transcriptional regulator [Spirochaetota bacterium]|nr:TetR/AcrR family transcriptional regulator [Spirochaetota bacterium]